jgi:predicted P-loop ATPase
MGSDDELPPQDSTNPTAKGESPPLQPGAAATAAKTPTVVAFKRFKNRRGKAGEQADQGGEDTNNSDRKPKKIRAFYTSKNPSGYASSFDNAITAIEALKIECRYDVFHDCMLVSSHPLEIGTDENLDSVTLMVRRQIVDTYGFDPGQQNTFDAIKSRCLDNMFDPIVDYLDGLKWDGVLRLDRWLTTHLDAEDNPLNRAIGRKMLVAAVRRVHQPGCKFDFIPVMDNSKQGKGKSTVILILAGQENFSDQDLLGLSNQEQQEQIQGVWLYELAELSGLAKADINRVKSFASRQFDRARPAYGRNRIDRPRRGIQIGTTNDPEYLQDPTGNRRFWPFTPGNIKIELVRQDRDQLWAEAALAEATGEALIIPEELWPDIEDRQSSRMISDPWEDLLANLEAKATMENIEGGHIAKAIDADGKPQWRVKSTFILATVLGIPSERVNTNHSRRLGSVMRKLGWNGPVNLRFAAQQSKGYFRPATDDATCYR